MLSLLILTGLCRPAERGADDFTRNWSWCRGLLTAEEGFPTLVSVFLLSYCSCMCVFAALLPPHDRYKECIMSHDYSLGDIYCVYDIYYVFLLSAESQLFLERKSPSLWLKGDYPTTPSKRLAERCLPTTTTPLCCQIDCCVNTQRTAVHSLTGSPDFLGSTDSVAKTALAAPLLRCLQTKVN